MVWRTPIFCHLSSSCHNLLLLTMVTWGHTWTDRLLFLTHSGLLWHTHTHAQKTPLHTESFDIHSHTGRHPFSIENTQSPFTLQNPHTTTSCLLGYTSSTHTRSRTCTLRHPNTHTRTSQRAPRLIASPFGWCHLFHTFCRWLTKSCSGWWCSEATWWKYLSWLVQDLWHDLRL